ncbi:MAG: hypothetical protein L0K86_04985 [Actinomycetia bacterium]|nr:hypothetical protein [Actinomycetes bacterium]
MAANPQRPSIQLDYPWSLGTYDQYEDAQKAVDYLSDQEFPVQNCMIVGTELKQVERVTGRLTYGRAAAAGAASGAWFGAFIGLMLGLFAEENWLATVLSAALIGVVFGMIFGLVSYAMTGGRRDFTSVTQVVATKYEVLVEHKHLAKAQQLLQQMPGRPIEW